MERSLRCLLVKVPWQINEYLKLCSRKKCFNYSLSEGILFNLSCVSTFLMSSCIIDLFLHCGCFPSYTVLSKYSCLSKAKLCSLHFDGCYLCWKTKYFHIGILICRSTFQFSNLAKNAMSAFLMDHISHPNRSSEWSTLYINILIDSFFQFLVQSTTTILKLQNDHLIMRKNNKVLFLFNSWIRVTSDLSLNSFLTYQVLFIEK